MTDVDDPGIQVEIRPAEAELLALAHAGSEGEADYQLRPLARYFEKRLDFI